MKNLVLAVTATALTCTATITAALLERDITSEIPSFRPFDEPYAINFERIDDVAQYKNADWSQVVGIAREVPLEIAYIIANEDPKISYFFYTKGGQMILEKENGDYRVFCHGDAVFFAGEPWWGSAPGLADGYIKISR